MKLKEAIYDNGCEKCGAGKKLVKNEVYGCDNCKKEVSSPYDNVRTYLEVTVFYKDAEEETRHFHFCSWECVFKFVKRIQKTKHKSNYFLNLPYISFDKELTRPIYKDFIKALKECSK
jgi:hypothetical protein